MKKILEVIATSVQDVKIINTSKADQIELVYDLSKGGLSPTISTVEDSLKETNIPINVMVRPHYKNFVYSESEFGEILIYIKKLNLLEKKPNGIVFGSLTEDGKINEDQLKEIIKIKGNLKLVFHRAFDEIKDYENSVHILNKYPEVFSLLTSGTNPKAIDSIKELNKIISLSKKMIILIGSGIGANNLNKLNKEVNSSAFHVGSSIREDNSIDRPIIVEKINNLKDIIIS